MHGTPMQKEFAAGTLVNMAFDDAVALAIARSGGVAPLLALTNIGTPGQKVRAAACLRNLAYTAEIGIQIAQLGLDPLVALINSGSNAAKEQAAGTLGNLGLDVRNRTAIQQAGGYEALNQLAMDGTPAQREVASAALQVLAHADEVSVLVLRG